MKVEIRSPFHPADGYTIINHSDNKKLINGNASLHPTHFTDEEIIYILDGPDGWQYKSFIEGKYTFDLPAWKIKAIRGENISPKKECVLFSLEYSEL